MRTIRILCALALTLLAVGLFSCAIAAEAAPPGILPAEGDFSDTARAWAEGLADTDWQALLDTARAQVSTDKPEAGFLASDVLLDGVTGPFLLVDMEGVMTESNAVLSDTFTRFFDQPDRWEALAAENAQPVFMVAERQEDRVAGTYSGGETISASVYRLYVIDGQGTLLGWDTAASIASTPYMLRTDSPRFFDQDPFPAYLDTMRYAREMMLVEGGVLVEYRSVAPAALVLPEGITAIGEEAFANQATLERLVLPASLSYIGKSAFIGCKGLTEVVFGEGLTEIGPYAFKSCSRLREVVFPDTLRRVGLSAFDLCSSLSRVVLNEGLERIEHDAFRHAFGLQSLALPSSLLSIGRSAFYGCESLADIDFGAGGCRIDTYAFSKTPWLAAQAGDYVVVGDTLVDYRGAAAAFAVPEGVRHVSVRIEDETLQSLTLPEGVQSIGSFAFDGCKGLADIAFPDSLTYVGDNALRNTAWLRALAEPVVVGSGVLFIPYGEGDPAEIPEGVTCVSQLGGGKQLTHPLVFPATCRYIVATGGVDMPEGGWVLHIPQGVVEIEADVLGGGQREGVVYCAPGSAAERWAREKGMEVIHE